MFAIFMEGGFNSCKHSVSRHELIKKPSGASLRVGGINMCLPIIPRNKIYPQSSKLQVSLSSFAHVGEISVET